MRVPTSTKSAHSPETSASEEESSSKYRYFRLLCGDYSLACDGSFFFQCFLLIIIAREGLTNNLKAPVLTAFIRGVVISTKMKNTIVIRRDYLHYIKKYNRFEKRHKTVTAHCSPAFRLRVGDVVTVGQCRPLSKTVRFNVIRQEVQHIEGNVRKVFVLF